MIEYYEQKNKDSILRGMIHRGMLGIPIIIVHGYFSSNRIGPYRLYYQLAEKINLLGYTVIRVDFSGMGESDGNIEDIRFCDHVSDLERIIESVLDDESICKGKKIHLIGHCIGCCTVLGVNESYWKNIESVTLLSPFIPSKDNHKALLGEANFDQIVQKGSGYRKGMYCCKSFLVAAYLLENPNALKLCKSVKCISVLAENDEYSTIQNSVKWAEENSVKYKIIKEANHNYTGTIIRQKLLDCFYHLFENY